MSKAYPSNLTRDQYECLRDLLPEPKPVDRPRTVRCEQSLMPSFMSWSKGCAGERYPEIFRHDKRSTPITAFTLLSQLGTYNRIAKLLAIATQRQPAK